MSKLDKMIEEALGAEDRALFSRYGEQGLIGQVGEMFSGKMGWWNWLTMLIQLIMLAGALYAAAKFIAVEDIAAMIRWGALAGLLVFAVSFIKLMHWEQMQANRIIREVKRLQLQIARAKD